MANEHKNRDKDKLARDNFRLTLLLAGIALAIYIGFISFYVI